MNKHIIALAIGLVAFGFTQESIAQSKKHKKSRYYQNNPVDADFDVKGFHQEPPKNEVDRKPVEEEYEVKIDRNERDGKYYGEKRIRKEKKEVEVQEEKVVKKKKEKSYYTTYGQKRVYDDNRKNYDKYFTGGATQNTTPPPPPLLTREETPAPVAAAPVKSKPKVRKEKEVKMTQNEQEYKTTVVKKRYTNLDVLCDDLDLAKIQRPVFKGICSECSRDVDAIITNKNMSSLEKNYILKQSYMLRDKRLRETLDDDQYKKWLRIKDSDEYLVITKDLELKDGVNE